MPPRDGAWRAVGRPGPAAVLRRYTAAALCCAGALMVPGVVHAAARATALPGRECPGDCNGDGRVSIGELVLAVDMALGRPPVDTCPAADPNGDDRVSIDELVSTVNAAFTGCPATTTPTPRPNFILIDLDDSRADGIDRMPTVLARLAGEGVSFRNSFVPLSLCCPSRASILSGRYAVHHGTRYLAGPIGGAHTFRESGVDRQTIAVWLQNAGYVTGFFGKYLNAYWEEHDKGPNGGFYVPPGWSRWRAFVVEHYGGRDGLGYEIVDETGARASYGDHTTDEQYSTTVLGRDLRQFVADAAAGGAPFFAVWTPYASHVDAPDLQPVPAARYLDVFMDIPLWRPPNWDEADRSDKPRWLQELDPSALFLAVTDQARERAYETLLTVDDEVGLLLDQLAALGIGDHTVIVLTSDNGVAWSEHGLWGQWKECPYEECLRVPMVVRYPRGVAGAPRAADTPVLNIDVPVTIGDLAGVSIPVATDGASFRAALEGETALRRGDFLLEHWSGNRDAADLSFSDQPLDGDRIRVFFGPWPKSSLAFEFDADGRVTAGSVAVPIQATAAESYFGLVSAIAAQVPNTSPLQVFGGVSVVDASPESVGVFWLDEVNQGARFTIAQPVIPDYFGVRDVAHGFTYVQHATSEVELYDLIADPWELRNKAGDPAYAATQARLAARMRQLLE